MSRTILFGFCLALASQIAAISANAAKPPPHELPTVAIVNPGNGQIISSDAMDVLVEYTAPYTNKKRRHSMDIELFINGVSTDLFTNPPDLPSGTALFSVDMTGYDSGPLNLMARACQSECVDSEMVTITKTEQPLSIFSPEPVSATFDQTVEVSGAIEPGLPWVDAYALVNLDQTVPYPLNPDPITGLFNVTLPLLTVGTDPVIVENQIDIVVVKADGTEIREILTVRYSFRYEQNALIVMLDEGEPVETLYNHNALIGASIRDSIEELNMYLISYPPPTTPHEALFHYMGTSVCGDCHYPHGGGGGGDLIEGVLSQVPGIKHAELNLFVEPDQVPNDPLFSMQSSLWLPTQTAWDITTGTSAVTLALVDSGFDHTHPDLVDNLWINQGELPQQLLATGDLDGDTLVTLRDANSPGGAAVFAAFGITDSNGNGIIDGADLLGAAAPTINNQDDDGNGFVDDLIGFSMTNIPGWETPNRDPMDLTAPVSPLNNGHGTAVAGILGASGNNNLGVAGLNWQTQIMPLRVENRANGMFDLWAIAAATVYAANNGARVANNSFSLYWPFFPLAWTGPYNLADSNNIMIAAAAGNRGLDMDATGHWPGNLSAVRGSVIQVAAYNANSNLANTTVDNFNSNFGVNTVNIAAPGTTSLVYSTRISYAPTFYAGWDFNPGPGLGRYGVFFGTSSATPHVAGTAGLILSVNNNLAGPAVRKMLLAGASSATDNSNISTLIQNGRILNEFGAVTLAQNSGAATNIATTLGANPIVNAEARVFDNQFSQQGNFYPFGLPLNGGVEVESGDVDGDGNDDLIFAVNSGSTTPNINVTDKAGNSLVSETIAAPGGIYTIAAADLDQDGDDEVLLLLPWTVNGQTVYRITAYSFNNQPRRLNYFGSSTLNFPSTSTLAAGDVDFDGMDEIVVGVPKVGGTLAQVEVYEISPGPGFPLTQNSFWTVGVQFSVEGVDVAVADVDGDGAGEIATVPTYATFPDSNSQTGRIFRLGGVQIATFIGWGPSPTLGKKPRVAAGDYDNDGIDEIIVGYEHPYLNIHDWTPYLGASGGTYSSTGFFPYGGGSLGTSIRPVVCR